MGSRCWRKPDKGAEPNLFVDDEGRWWVNAHIGGKKIERLIGPKALARKWLTREKEKARMRKLFPEEVEVRQANTLTVAQICARFRAADQAQNVTHKEHERMENVWLKILGDQKLWHEVTIETVTVQQSAWLAEGKGPARINRLVSRLHAVFQQAADAKVIRYNPISGYPSLQEPSARTRKLTFAEQRRLQAQLEPWQFDFVHFALLSGFRQAEQFKTRRDWVDLDANEIHLPDTKTPKGTKKGRIIPMSQRLRAVVLRLLERSEGCAWLCSNHSKRGAYNAGNFVGRIFEPALEAAGIEGLTWHDLRRTCGSRLHMAGAPVAAVQAYLGHENSETTDRYIAVASSELVDYVKLQDGDQVTRQVLVDVAKLQDLSEEEVAEDLDPKVESDE